MCARAAATPYSVVSLEANIMLLSIFMYFRVLRYKYFEGFDVLVCSDLEEYMCALCLDATVGAHVCTCRCNTIFRSELGGANILLGVLRF